MRLSHLKADRAMREIEISQGWSHTKNSLVDVKIDRNGDYKLLKNTKSAKNISVKSFRCELAHRSVQRLSNVI